MSDQATCYFPDRTTSAGSFPCWNSTVSTDGYAPCCFNSAYCFSNGLCLDSNKMTVYRAGCTDESWVSSNCAKFCTGANIGGLFKCDDAGNSGCFASDCGTEHQFLTPSGSLMRAGPAVTSALGLSDNAAPSASASQPTPTPSHAPQTSTGISTGAAVGIGVGVGLPLLILCFTFVWLFLKEKRRSKSAMGNHPKSNYTQANPTQSYDKMKSPPPEYPPVHEMGPGHGRVQLHGEPRAQLP